MAEVPPGPLCHPAAGHAAGHPGASPGGQALRGSCDHVLPSKAGESPGRGGLAAPCGPALAHWAQVLGLSPRTLPKPTWTPHLMCCLRWPEVLDSALPEPRKQPGEVAEVTARRL